MNTRANPGPAAHTLPAARARGELPSTGEVPQ